MAAIAATSGSFMMVRAMMHLLRKVSTAVGGTCPAPIAVAKTDATLRSALGVATVDAVPAPTGWATGARFGVKVRHDQKRAQCRDLPLAAIGMVATRRWGCWLGGAVRGV